MLVRAVAKKDATGGFQEQYLKNGIKIESLINACVFGRALLTHRGVEAMVVLAFKQLFMDFGWNVDLGAVGTMYVVVRQA